MSNNSSSEKSEKPTAGKLRKAKQKGEIPRSKDMTMAAGLVAAFITLSAFFPYYKQLIEESFIAIGMMAGNIDDPIAVEQLIFRNVLILFKFIATLIPIPVAMMIAALIPGGWNFTPKRIMPDLKKLNPLSGFKRIFSASHMTDMLKMIAKCSIVLILLYQLLQSELSAFLHLQATWLTNAINAGFAIYQDLLLYFIVTVVFFAVIDIPLSKHLFTKKLKMTKQEVKEEHKNNEGNPQIKARLRQLQRQFAMGQINKAVPQASVVITNPTHYAIALKYDPNKAKAPYILTKGVDEIALYIREVANKNKVEVVEFPPLARALYYSTRINQQIPTPLYKAIAHVLSYVMQLKAWREGKNDKPHLNTQIQIPQEALPFHE